MFMYSICSGRAQASFLSQCIVSDPELISVSLCAFPISQERPRASASAYWQLQLVAVESLAAMSKVSPVR